MYVELHLFLFFFPKMSITDPNKYCEPSFSISVMG